MNREIIKKDQQKIELEKLKMKVDQLESIRTEYRLIEEALRESEKKYKKLIDKSLSGIYIVQNHTLKFCNQRYAEIFGYDSPEEILGKNINGLVASISWELVDSEIKLRESAKKESSQYEFKGIKKDGNIIDLEVLGVGITLNGKPAVQGMINDITKRKNAEEKLRDSELKFRSLFDLSPHSIFVTEVEKGSLIDVNNKFCELINYTKEEILGRTTTELNLYSERDRKKFLGKIKESGEIHGLEMNFNSKDGNMINTFIFAKLIQIEDNEFILSELLNVTERKQLEAQLKHAQRMEGIGTLAGGIAHDFNNILMGIQGNSNLMLLKIDPDHPHYERLKSIEQLIDSGTELTKQLLGFARGGKYEVKPTDLNDVVTRTSNIFGRTKKEIKISKELQKDIWLVDADRGQVEQVLMNLYVNAWQAMAEGGKIYLETKNVTIDKNYVKPFKIKLGNYVRISVTDTGMGIDEETQQKIFDPFFTTKEMGRGTGLGLASAYGIIKNHGGFINVYSKIGKGTTFNIYLPVSEGRHKEEETEAPREIITGNEQILLVDDEAIILDVGEQILKTIGYKVVCARGGKEAIEIYKKNKDSIDLVILDMIMPDMGGGTTYDTLKDFDPHIKVLLSSGYSKNGLAGEILNRGCNGFIQKPFSIKELSHKIREIIDS